MKINTTGKADIIIKSYTDYAAEKTYRKGQPISILKDASYEINFHSENREVRKGVSNLLGFTNYAPYQIKIEPVNITKSLADIIYKKKIKENLFDLPVNEVQESNIEGEIYLRERSEDGSVLERKVFVLNDKGEAVSAAIDYETGTISGLAPEKLYNISYYVEAEVQFGYKLGKTYAPYFSLEIINRDDFGTQGINTFIKIPKVALFIEPELNFNKDNITNISLVFNILDEDIEIIFH